ncbi:hypothetical protein [Mucilaginibacter xinganensis]|uniref:Uncharacterized protein n=1 Tax=Mucilaginibacter xinganensis TaxID=1234841 RepID=A0A223NXP4_9SPHI|nr:hypothetical protein [Mucilaginibacter xinganensis]ASU34358.1 hypothetical protein MuYL_2471 [Mucilaginibacter xinganensis]
MQGTVREIYSVENSQFTTVESLRAIQRAKEIALSTKTKVKVFLNGNPLYLVDRKGNLAAA